MRSLALATRGAASLAAALALSLFVAPAGAEEAPAAKPTDPAALPTMPATTLAPAPNPDASPVIPAPAPASLAPPPPRAGIVEFSSLRLMREKGIITEAEYASAVSAVGESTGYRAPDAMSLVVGKWSTTIYGFAEMDLINDSTQSFNDTAGNGLVLRPNGLPPPPPANEQNTYAANHGRTQMSIRNTRLGLQMRAPETHGLRASGVIEADFEGYLPAPSAPSGTTESQFFSSPAIRLRHAYLKLESPWVDLLVGQYWDLFGWQNAYHPNSVDVQGLPGELYARDAQIRLSHAWKTKPIEVEVAAAARRPPSRNSQLPEGQAGLRVSFPWWTGVTTTGATSTNVMPMSIAVTGDIRQFGVPEFSQTPTRTVSLTTEALAVDAFIPVIPQKRTNAGNALSLTGEIATGSGFSDLYTSFTSGLTFPTIKNTSVVETSTPLPYPQDVDNGMVTYDTSGNLHAIQLTTFIVGAQYYLPGLAGHVWLSGNFARTQSGNIAQFTRPAAALADPTMSQSPSDATVVQSENFFDGNIFWDIVAGARVGVEYANFNDRYVDGVHASNNRFQFSGYFIF